MRWAATGSTCILIMSSRGAWVARTRRRIFNCCAVLATGRKVTVSILPRSSLLLFLRLVSHFPRRLTTGHILGASTSPLCRRWRKSPPPTPGSGSDLVSARLRRTPAIAPRSHTSFRLQTSIMTQALGFIVAADTLLLGYGFSQREAGILLIASFMPLAFAVAYIEVLRHAAPVAYVAIRLEKILLAGELTLAGHVCRCTARNRLRAH